MSWKDSSSGLRYTTCWMGDYVTSVVQYRLFPFLSVPDSSDIDPAYLPLLILLIFWHCDIPPPPPLSRLPHSDEICSFQSWGENGTFKTSSSLWQFWDALSPMVNLSPCGMPGGVLGADQWSLLSLTLGDRKRKKPRETEKEREEQRENESDKGPETDPSHSAEPREYAARLSAPLISQMQPLWQCDTDYWKPWFRLSLLLCVAANSVS